MPGGVLPQKTPSQRKALRDAIQQPNVPTWEDLLIGAGAVGAPIAAGVSGIGAGADAAAADGAAAGGAGKAAASGAAGGAASTAAKDAVKVAGGAALGASVLGDTQMWVRVLEAVGAVLLLVLGLRALLGGDSPVQTVTNAVGRRI